VAVSFHPAGSVTGRWAVSKALGLIVNAYEISKLAHGALLARNKRRNRFDLACWLPERILGDRPS
jgi:hypothetical protein